MDKVEFIKRVKQVVATGAIKGTLDNLNNPPGRKPDSQLLIQSSWFKELNDTDREIVSKLISEAVHEAVFGFLCVLDDVRSINGSGESNNLQLLHNGMALNDTNGEFLHDIYKNV
ncbi:hypothetical protein [Methylomicrobium lacus]|uniref:hypothetical protein n=1 Tax=Methylomicrobium lacus TaxID=136992 RepID=UPI00045E60CF|nr:hypothetical protein [Methylomicrobium lacus]